MRACIAHVAITSFNRIESTKRCIESLRDNTKMDVCISVVDNASTDGSDKYLLDLKARGTIDEVFLCKRNSGVAIASNLAWSAVDAPYYIKLDNDVEILREDWLETLLAVEQSTDNVGTVGYYIEDGRAESATSSASFIVERCVGSCILIPRKTHDVLGFWSEDYGIYGIEDSDFSTRVSIAGMHNHYISFSEKYIKHTHKAYSGDSAYDHEIRNVQGLTDEYTAKFYFNSAMYMTGVRALYVQRKFVPQKNGDLYEFSPDPAYLAQENFYRKDQYKFIAEYCEAVKKEGEINA